MYIYSMILYTGVFYSLWQCPRLWQYSKSITSDPVTYKFCHEHLLEPDLVNCHELLAPCNVELFVLLRASHRLPTNSGVLAHYKCPYILAYINLYHSTQLKREITPYDQN